MKNSDSLGRNAQYEKSVGTSVCQPYEIRPLPSPCCNSFVVLE